MPPTLRNRGTNQHTRKGGLLDIQVDAEGVGEVARALRRFKDKELSDEMRDAANEWAKLVASRAQSILAAQTDGTGKLAKAIRPASTRTIARVRVAGGQKRYYRWMVHSGHEFRGGSGRYEGVPYLRDAVRLEWREGLKRWNENLDKVIKRFNHRYGGGRPE